MTHVGRTGPPEPGGRNSAGLIGTLCGVVGMLASVHAALRGIAAAGATMARSGDYSGLARMAEALERFELRASARGRAERNEIA